MFLLFQVHWQELRSGGILDLKKSCCTYMFTNTNFIWVCTLKIHRLIGAISSIAVLSGHHRNKVVMGPGGKKKLLLLQYSTVLYWNQAIKEKKKCHWVKAHSIYTVLDGILAVGGLSVSDTHSSWVHTYAHLGIALSWVVSQLSMLHNVMFNQEPHAIFT